MTTSIKILKRIALIVCPLVLLLSTGCKKFLNVNQDPNNANAASPSQLLPTIEASIGVVIGDDYYTYGNIWSQYYTQSAVASQYKTIDQYLENNSDFNYAWTHLYQDALINDQLMITSSAGSPTAVQYVAIGYVLKAYALQLATDAFGDVPNSQASQGAANKNPTYDPQQQVYDSIFALIERGKALMSDTDPNAPGSDDLLFQGDMDKWIAFANTLELRAYMRLSQVDPATAQTGINALLANNAPLITKTAELNYSSTGGNQNPFYIKEVGLNETVNLAASGTVISQFVRNNDPRQFHLFTMIDTATPPPPDTITYLNQGTYATNTNKKTSQPSAMTGGNALDPNSALAPVIFISLAETDFLQAEAIARGWASGNAADLFKAGINASFATDSIPDSAAAYIANAPDAQFPSAAADQIKAIITQKYYAMCGLEGFEAWTEWRRTGYPTFFVPSAAGGGRPMPLRFLYPQTELTGNLSFPGTVPQTTPVWWDK